MNKTGRTLLSIALLSLAASSAVAKDKDDDDGHRCHGNSRHCWSAPEIDPGEAIAGLTLLGGSIAIIRGYRRRKK